MPPPTNAGPGYYGPGYGPPAPGYGPAVPLPPGAGLGAALAGGYDAARPAGGYIPGRQVPAWHDLTGAPADAGLIPGEQPLPQRRPLGSDDVGGIPRQPVPTDNWATAPQPSSRPPTWPPVADDVRSLPGGLSASLDMTSELPRARAAGGYATAAPDPVRNGEDMTQELPIFRELESAWFTPPPPGNGPSGPAPGWPPSDTGAAVRARTGDQWSEHGASTYGASMPGAAMAGSARGSASAPRWSGRAEAATGMPGEVSWRSAADEGWQAAQAAGEPYDGGNTDTGLPRRVPMAQLVPGGVDNATGPGGSDKRSPDSVRGLLSAYHRGVQRGRTQGAGDAVPDPQSSGREQEA